MRGPSEEGPRGGEGPPSGVVTSRRNPLVRELRSVVKAPPRRTGRCVVEGWRLLGAALEAGAHLDIVLVTPSAAGSSRWPPIRDQVESRGVRWILVSAEVLEALTQVETPQGVLGIASCPRPASPDVFRDPSALVVVLDAVQDPGNVGAIVRTALAAGANAGVIVGATADPVSPKALRASAGAAFRLPLLHVPSAEEASAMLATSGLRVVVADPRGEVSWDQVDLSRPCALVVGSEGGGASPAWSRAGAVSVRIPMVGPVESLNVAAAAAVLLYKAAGVLGARPERVAG